MNAAIDKAGKPAMTRERIDAIRAADTRIHQRTIGVTEEIEEAVANAFDCDDCEEIEITCPRNHFHDGWYFPHKVRCVHNDIEAEFEFYDITRSDAGFSICFERA